MLRRIAPAACRHLQQLPQQELGGISRGNGESVDVPNQTLAQEVQGLEIALELFCCSHLVPIVSCCCIWIAAASRHLQRLPQQARRLNFERKRIIDVPAQRAASEALAREFQGLELYDQFVLYPFGTLDIAQIPRVPAYPPICQAVPNSITRSNNENWRRGWEPVLDGYLIGNRVLHQNVCSNTFYLHLTRGEVKEGIYQKPAFIPFYYLTRFQGSIRVRAQQFQGLHLGFLSSSLCQYVAIFCFPQFVTSNDHSGFSGVFSIVLSKLKEHECKLLASEDKLRNFARKQETWQIQMPMDYKVCSFSFYILNFQGLYLFAFWLKVHIRLGCFDENV